MYKEEITIKFTAEVDDYKLQEVKAQIFDFLKTLDIIKLEMEEQ